MGDDNAANSVAALVQQYRRAMPGELARLRRERAAIEQGPGLENVRPGAK